MGKRRQGLRLATLIVLCLVVVPFSGCGGGREEPVTGSSPFHVNLPRLHVTYDEQGEPSILGLSLSMVERVVPADLSMLRLAPEQVQQLMGWNIQHIELAVAADGLFIFVNNRPMPHLAWGSDALETVGELADDMELLPSSVARFVSLQKGLPLVLIGLGSGAHIEFPVATGQEAISFEAHPNGVAVSVSPEVEQVPLKVHLPLEYDREGEPSVEGVQIEELGALAGQPVTTGRLDQAGMEMLQRAEVGGVIVRMEPRGLVPYVDGDPLPYITWDDEHLLNLIELADSTGLASSIPGGSELMRLLHEAAPGVRKIDVQISAEFPE